MNRRLFLQAAASVAFPVAFTPCSVEPLRLVPWPLDADRPKEADTWTLDRLDFVANGGEALRMPPNWKTLWEPWIPGIPYEPEENAFICVAQAAVGEPFIRSGNWPAIEIRTGHHGIVLSHVNLAHFGESLEIHQGETYRLLPFLAQYSRGERVGFYYHGMEGIQIQ